MVIGNGIVATEFFDFKEDNDVVLFASGVSNSRETLEANFKREENLLLDALKEYSNGTFVYFSTCSIYDSSLNNSLYVNHKLNMERIIQEKASKYKIFRISNIVGKTPNPNTLTNYLANCIVNEKKFEVWRKATRNLIDIIDIGKLVRGELKRPQENNIVNIANSENYSLFEIVSGLEFALEKQANYSVVDKGADFEIDISYIKLFKEKLGVFFGENYLKELLIRYYKK